MTDNERRIATLAGAYQACDALMRSPRMNRPQREVIQDLADAYRAELEGLGVRFRERTAGEQIGSSAAVAMEGTQQT